MTNYAKLGEYTAYKKQAQDAASVRRSYLTVLSDKASTLRSCSSMPVDSDEFAGLLEKIQRADAEMRAALAAANLAAPLCGENPLEYKTFESL